MTDEKNVLKKAPKKDKTKTRLIVTLSVLAVTIIAAIVVTASILSKTLPEMQLKQRDAKNVSSLAEAHNALVSYQTANANKSNNFPGEGSWAPEGTTFPENCDGNSACAFVRDYLSSSKTSNTFVDGSNTPYSLVIAGTFTKGVLTYEPLSDASKLAGNATDGYTFASEDHTGVTYIIPGSTCKNNRVVPGGRRAFSVLFRLESGEVYCQN